MIALASSVVKKWESLMRWEAFSMLPRLPRKMLPSPLLVFEGKSMIDLGCKYRILVILFAGLQGLMLQAASAQTPKTETNQLELSAMSFNIRNGRANDGENAWEFRKDFVGDVIRESQSDVVGLQEAYRFQLDEIRKQLPEFNEVGEGRDGKDKGEYSAVLYRKDRFEAIESGTFWLSNTPEVKSRHWGNRYLRICTWVHLREIQSGRGFYVYNTHFDHQSQNARLKSAQLLAQRIRDRKTSDPFILMGDFNADETNPVILYLKGEIDSDAGDPLRLVDTFRKLHPDEMAVGTGGGFEGRIDGKKIDYIFVEAPTETLKSAIVRTSRDGRLPSDHFPVTATLRLRYVP
jgi:endonuclease/exonuclease/phosphatase family metal-dependent hydrolase